MAKSTWYICLAPMTQTHQRCICSQPSDAQVRISLIMGTKMCCDCPAVTYDLHWFHRIASQTPGNPDQQLLVSSPMSYACSTWVSPVLASIALDGITASIMCSSTTYATV